MRILSMLLVMIGMSAAQAQIVFAPALTYSTVQVESAGVTSTDFDSMVLDLKVGYQHASGLFLGGMYTMNDSRIFNDGDGGFRLGQQLVSLTTQVFTLFLRTISWLSLSKAIAQESSLMVLDRRSTLVGCSR